jgi:hypothetical protein
MRYGHKNFCLLALHHEINFLKVNCVLLSIDGKENCECFSFSFHLKVESGKTKIPGSGFSKTADLDQIWINPEKIQVQKNPACPKNLDSGPGSGKIQIWIQIQCRTKRYKKTTI